MANEYTDLRLNPNDYLGLSYNKYRNHLYKTALVSPEEYYELRERVESKLQTQAIGALYDTIYYALKDGKEADGSTDLGLPVQPCVPISKINQICLDSCETLNEIITEHVLNLLLPIDYNQLMSSRLKEKGLSKSLGDV